MTNTNQNGGQVDPRKLMTGAAEKKTSGYNIHDEEIFVKKKNKMLYIEEDLLEVLHAEAEQRPKGWPSKVISQSLRRTLEENGLFEKHGIENLKKRK